MTTATPIDAWPRPLAFTLSGGGSYGAVQVGMIRALAEAGIHPDLVVGSSVGALNGVVLAANPDDAATHLVDVWTSLDRSTVFGGSRARAVRTLLATRTSLSRPDLVADLIAQHCPVKTFEQLDMKFAAVATDALTGDAVVISAGLLGPALLASSALPGVFPKVEVEGRVLLDGGVAANVPVMEAIALGARSMIVLDAMPAQSATSVPSGLVSGLLHTVSLLIKSQGRAAVSGAPAGLPMLHLPSPIPPGIGSFDFDHTEQLIEAGHRATIELLGRRAET